MVGALPRLAVGLQREPHRDKHPRTALGDAVIPNSTNLAASFAKRSGVATSNATETRIPAVPSSNNARDPFRSPGSFHGSASARHPARRTRPGSDGVTTLDLLKPAPTVDSPTCPWRARPPRSRHDPATGPRPPPTTAGRAHPARPDDQPPLLDRGLVDHRTKHGCSIRRSPPPSCNYYDGNPKRTTIRCFINGGANLAAVRSGDRCRFGRAAADHLCIGLPPQPRATARPSCPID